MTYQPPWQAPQAQRSTPVNPDELPTSTKLGRVMFWMQWATPVFVSAMFVIGRLFLGLGAGWMFLVGLILLAPPILGVGFAAAGLTMLRPSTRATKSLPPLSAACNLSIWPLMLVMLVFLPGGDDAGAPAAKSFAVYRLGMDDSQASGIGMLLILLMLLAAIAYFVLAFAEPRRKK